MPLSSESAAAHPAGESSQSASYDTAAVVRYMAHELRQPLSTMESIAYYLGIVLPRTETRARLQLAKLQEQVRQINWVLADAIHFVQALPLQLQLLDLNEVISSSMAEWAKTEGMKAQLNLSDCLPPIRLDLEQARHLLRSLLLFLLRHSTPENPITVSTSARPGEVCLKVSSAMNSFKSEEIESLFEPFQVHYGPASGLALASVARIAEAHGGRVEGQSESGDGISVTVVFPVAE
jgi:signal transduction histidine kinase